MPPLSTRPQDGKTPLEVCEDKSEDGAAKRAAKDATCALLRNPLRQSSGMAAQAAADAAKKEAEAAAARKAAEAAAAEREKRQQIEADAAAAAQRIAAAQQQATAAAAKAAEEAAARKAAEALAAAAERDKAASFEAVRKAAADAAAAAAAVPAELETWLETLQLSEHGPRLVAYHKLKSVANCRYLDESDLLGSGLVKAEARRFLAATAKLGGDTKRLSGLAAAPAEGIAAAAGARACVRALVIGINAYAAPPNGPGKLDNAVADATAVHKALSALPGAASTLLTDCSKTVLEQALVDFRDGTGKCKDRGMKVTAAPASPEASSRVLGIVFFAGHGLQVSGRNYLVPSDFRVPNKNPKLEVMLRDTAKACVPLGEVEQLLEDAGMLAGAVLLDCCRNVPDFLAELGATRSAGGGTRALPSGMADCKTSTENLLVAFATKPGECALDRSSRLASHSPFTAALLRSLEAPRRLNDLPMFLVDEVKRDTRDQQCPQALATWGTEAGTLLLG